MSDPNPAPSEQPAQQATPVQTQGEQPAVTDHSATIQNLDQTQLEELLYGEKKEVPAAPPEPPSAEVTPPAVVPPTAAPAAGAQPPEEPPKPDAEEPSSLRRLAMGGIPMSERQQMAEVTRMIREGEATTQIEALQKMGVLPQTPPAGAQPAATETRQNPDPEPPASEPPSATQAIADSIAALREQRKQAKADFDVEAEERLTTQIEDQVVQLAEAKAEERIAAAAAASNQRGQARDYQGQYLAAVDAMEEQFPWATDENDPRYQMLDDKVTAARARGDEALQDPSFILGFAKALDGIGKPAPVAKPPPPPAPAERIVGGSVAPGHTVAHQHSPAEVRAIVDSCTEEQLAAALYG